MIVFAMPEKAPPPRKVQLVLEQLKEVLSKALLLQVKQVEFIVSTTSSTVIPIFIVAVIAAFTERFFPKIIISVKRTTEYAASAITGNFVEFAAIIIVSVAIAGTVAILFSSEIKLKRQRIVQAEEMSRLRRYYNDTLRAQRATQGLQRNDSDSLPPTNPRAPSPTPAPERIVRTKSHGSFSNRAPGNYLEIYTQFKSRMQNEEIRLKQNSGINLIWGIIFSLSAAIFLLVTIYYKKPTPIQSTQQFIEIYGPRATLAAILELISFFFLRLYNSTEQEIKHHKNEITNMESKFAAAMMMLEAPTPVTRLQVIKGFMDEERNFIIRKNERTVASEIVNNYNDFAEILSALATRRNKKK